MIPILYNSDETVFASNGLGQLSDCLKCEVTEELNGAYTLEMEYPITGLHYADISGDKLLKVKVSDGSMQIFRINQIKRVLNKQITVKAQHISYDLLKRTCWAVNSRSSTSISIQEVWNALQGSVTPAIGGTAPRVLPTITDFSFWSDITRTVRSTDIYNATFYRGNSVKSMLMDEDNISFFNAFGGEFEWDNKTVKMWSRRGADRNVTIRYGKNMMNLTAVENTFVYDAVLPYKKNGNSKTILNQNQGWNQVIYNGSSADVKAVVPLNMTDMMSKYKGNLGEKARQWFNENQPWLPVTEIQVAFVMQDDNTKALSKILLGDTIHIIHTDFNVNGQLRCVKTVWDSLKERYKSMTLSKNLSSLTGDLSRFKRQTQKKIDETSQELSNNISTVDTKAGNAQTTANNAATAASTAQTTANSAATAASNADDKAESIADGTYSNQGGFINKKAISGATSISSADITSTGGSIKLGNATLTFSGGYLFINGQKIVTQ